jgi:hypothetical protein
MIYIAPILIVLLIVFLLTWIYTVALFWGLVLTVEGAVRYGRVLADPAYMIKETPLYYGGSFERFWDVR